MVSLATMISRDTLSRRGFLATAAATPLVAASKGKRYPVALELYSVRDRMNDVMGTVRAVAKLGYEGVEFYSPYYEWTPAFAKDVRKLLDDCGIKCFSTHNGPEAFAPQNYAKSIDLNSTIGANIIVMASAGKVEGLDGWKKVGATLTSASEKFQTAKLRAGYHNHAAEFKAVDGKMPIEVLAAATPKNVVLQLDVGTCVEVGADPVAWINKNPKRIACIHCKDWGPEKGYRVLFGEGKSPWKAIFAAAEKTGGLEYYIIEQEGSDYSSMETAERCLATFKKMRA